MTQAPTPGPLTSESVKLLVKGDLLWAAVHGAPVTVIEAVGASVSYRHPEYAPDGCVIVGKGLEWLAFIGRPDADGWMPWSGGENPVPGQRVQWRTRNETDRVMSVLSNNLDWTHECRRGFDPIIAFRLAPTAPVEASGSELHPATADLVDRFAAELKSKLAKAEAKYGYRDNWSRPDWEDELTESLAEHIQKGDPRDVAAYCAFAWHHGWSTSDAAGYFAPALRPQPSGETREAVARALGAQRGHPEPWPTDYYDADAALKALLSARPLALGGQQGVDRGRVEAIVREAVVVASVDVPDKFADRVATRFEITKNATDAIVSALSTTPARAEAQDEDTPCTDCGDTGVTHQTERRCSCQEAEAQDEGAAGERVVPASKLLDLAGRLDQRAQTARYEASQKEATPGGASAIAGYLFSAVSYEMTAENIRKLANDAHPSPTPAADADGVIRVLERICETQKRLYGNGTGLHLAMLDLCIDARAELSLYRAALKSTAAKEGGTK